MNEFYFWFREVFLVCMLDLVLNDLVVFKNEILFLKYEYLL